MTKTEGDRIDALTQVLFELKGRVESVIEAVPDLMTKEMCEERHSNSVGKIGELAEDGKQTVRFTERLRGMGVPVALFVAVIGIVLTFVR